MKNTIAIRFRFRVRRLRTTLRKRLRALNKKALGVTLAILPIGLAPLASAQSTTTYGSGATIENGNTATTIVLDDGALVTTIGLVSGTPTPLVYSGNPDVVMNGTSVLTITNTDEVFAGLSSISGGASIVLDGGSDVTINLGFTGPTTTSPATNSYNGTITASQGSVLMLTGGTGVMTFDGGVNSLNLDAVTTLNDGSFGNGPIFANVGGCLIGTAGFVVGNGVTVNTETEVIADGTSVQVDGVLNLLGDETVEDLYITANGMVDAGGALNVRDTLIVDGTLDTSAALCAAILKGSGTINAGGDVLLFPSVASVVNITFNTTHDFLKFGDGSLTLTQNQGIEGATWVQAGALTLQGTSAATEFVVAESITSPEATGGSAYDGGGVYEDLAGNVDSALLAGKAGTVDPTLNINAAADSALTITIGSNDGVDSGADGNADSATVNTGGANLLADAADVTIYNSANLNLGGDEIINSVTFDDATPFSAEALTSVRGQVTLGGVTTIETLTSQISGNGVVNMGANTLNLATGNSSYEYSGVFNGAVASILNKNGTGELSLTGNSATDGIFNGTVNVNVGILEVQNNGALGLTGAAGGSGAVSAGGETNVFSGTELQLNNTAFGNLSIADNLNIVGCGVDGATGAIHNELGDNTLTGQITLTGTSSLFAADGTSLTTNGLITSLVGADPTLFLDGAGNFDVNGLVDVNISTLYKTGTGIADISGTNHGYQTSTAADGVADTVIQNGVLRIDNLNNLGGVNADVVAFVGDTNNSAELPTLDYVPAGASGNTTLNQSIVVDSSLADAKYAAATSDLIHDVATINVDDNNLTASDSSLTIDLDRLGAGNTNVTFADTTSGLYKTGTDDLILNAVNSTTVAAPGSTGITGGSTIANLGLDPVDVVLGGVLNPSDGNVIVNGPGTTDNGANCFGPEAGSSNFIIAGLGSIDAIAVTAGTNNDGTLIVSDFDNLVVNQSTNTTFNGALNTAANFVYNGNGNALTLGGSALGTGFSGNIYIGDGRLVAGGDNALGTIAGDYEMASTFICGTHQTDPTQPFGSTNRTDFGILAISGDANIFENITIVNDGLLVNQDGSNTINAPVRLQYDAATDVLGGDEAYGVIGAEAGDLTIANGVFGDTGTNVGLKLNTGTINPADGTIVVAHNGTLNLGPIARDSVQDIQIGHAGSTGTVNLLGANAHEGQTFLFGGNVVAGNTAAFSGGDVIVDGATSLAGNVALGNDIQLNADLTSNEATGTLRLDGTVSGSGAITHTGAGTLALAGVNNFTGKLTAGAGTVDVLTALTTNSVQVDSGATLNTTGADFLNSATPLINNGAVNLGGDQSLVNVSGSGSVAIGANDLTLTDQGDFAGGFTGTGGLDISGNTALSGTSDFTGDLAITGGSTNITGTIEAANVDVASGAGLTVDGASLVDSSNVNIDGTLTVANNEIVGTLTASGTVAGSGTLTAGTYNLDGASVAANLGAGTLNSDGTTQLDGTSAATAVNVNSGTLVLGSADRLANGAAVNLTGDLDLGGNETIDSLAGTGSVITNSGETLTTTGDSSFDGDITGTGGYTVNGGVSSLNNGASYTGATTVTAGTLQVGGALASNDLDVVSGASLETTTANVLSDSASVAVDGTVTLGGNETVGSISGAGSLVNGGNDLTVGAGDFSGVISGAGDLIKESNGTLILSGANTYGGETLVNQGTLHVDGGSLLSDEITVANNATLQLTDAQFAANSELVNSGTVQIAGDNSIGNLFGGATGVVDLGMDASDTLTVQGGVYDGLIQGSGGLTKDGTGTLTLNGANTYAGATNVNGGTLQLNGTIASGDVTVDGASLILGSGERINDAATLTVTGGGTITLNGDETVATANLGEQSVGGTGELIADTFTLNGTEVNTGITGGTVATGGSGTTTTINAASSADSLTVANTDTLDLNATFGTDVVTAEGTLNLGGADLLNSTAAVDVDGALNLGGDQTLSTVTGNGSVAIGANDLTLTDQGTFAGGFTGTGNLDIVGNAELSGASDFTGDLAITGGSTDITGSIEAANVDVASGTGLTVNGTSLADTAAVNVDGTFTINSAETIGSLTATGTVDGAGVLTAATYDLDGALVNADLGAGVLTSNGATQLNGTSDAEVVNVESGVLALGSDSGLADNAAVNLTGDLDLARSETVGSLAGTGSVLTNAGEILTTTGDSSFDGDITGAGGYTVNGGTSSLNNGATYTGATTVTAGTLSIGGALASNDLNVATGAELATSAANVLSDAATATVDGTLTFGGSETLTAVTGGGTVAIEASDLTLTDQGTFAGGFTGTGNLDIAGSAVLSGSSNFTGDLAITGGSTDITGSIAAANVDVASGTGLTVNGTSLADTAAVNVDGTFTINSAETIGSLTATGTVDGAGVLTAATYDLDGALVNADLGAGVLTSNGATQLNGTSDAEVVNVESGVLALGSDSGLADNAAVNLTGDLDLARSETVGSLAGTGSVLTNAGEILTTTGDSSFDGDITGVGGYTVNGGTSSLNNGATYTGVTTVTAGTLSVGGALASNDLNVATGAELETTTANVLSDSADLALAGTLNLGGDEAISGLTGSGTINNGGNTLGVASGSFGGTIAGTGGLDKIGEEALTLSGVNSFTGEIDVQAGELNVSSSIASASAINVDSLATLNLTGGSLLGFDSDLTVDGIANLQSEAGGTRLNGGGQVNVAGSFDVTGGNYQGDLDVANTLFITGDLIADGAISADIVELALEPSFVLNGSLDYNSLVGTGSIVANSFTNDAVIAPGGGGATDITGEISFTGDYIETANYQVDVNSLVDSDTLSVGGVASLDRGTSVVDVNDPTDALAALGSRTNIIDATGGIIGGLSALNGNGLSSPDLLFDLGTGDVASLGNGTFDAFDDNSQAIVDAIIRGEVDGVNFDSTAASGSLLDGLILSAGAGNVESAISAISPEAYAGAVDYAMDATRSYSRVARSAPALTVVGGGAQATINVPDAKGETPYTVSLPDGMSVEVMAGFNHFESGSDTSNSGNDYDLSGSGGYAGIRVNGNDGNFMVGLFTGFNDGSLSSSSIDLDGEGFVFGAFAEFKPQKNGLWTVNADIAAGNFSFDGSHRTQLGSSDAEFDTTAFEMGFGVDYLAYERDGLMVRPSIGFRYLSSTSDSFSENGGTGALNVDSIDASSSLIDLGVEFAYMPHQSRYGFSSYLGYQVNLSDNDRSVSATFANGTGFEVDAPGYGDGAFVYDFGAHYDVTDRFRIHAGVRGEVRSDAETLNGANLGGSFSF